MTIYRHRRREDNRRGLAGWGLQPVRRGWIAVLFVLLIVALAGFGVIYGAQIAKNTRRLHQTDYGLCQRQMDLRAAFHDATGVRVPLYDCTPNLRGGNAPRLTPAQAEAFEREAKAHDYVP